MGNHSGCSDVIVACVVDKSLSSVVALWAAVLITAVSSDDVMSSSSSSAVGLASCSVLAVLSFSVVARLCTSAFELTAASSFSSTESSDGKISAFCCAIDGGAIHGQNSGRAALISA